MADHLPSDTNALCKQAVIALYQALWGNYLFWRVIRQGEVQDICGRDIDVETSLNNAKRHLSGFINKIWGAEEQPGKPVIFYADGKHEVLKEVTPSNLPDFDENQMLVLIKYFDALQDYSHLTSYRYSHEPSFNVWVDASQKNFNENAALARDLFDQLEQQLPQPSTRTRREEYAYHGGRPPYPSDTIAGGEGGGVVLARDSSPVVKG